MKKNLLPGVPLVESPFFRKSFSKDNIELYKIASDLNQKGFSVVRGLIPNIHNMCDSIIEDIKGNFIFDPENEDDRNNFKGAHRFRDGWKNYQSVRNLAGEPLILELLNQLYGRKAFVYQTLNFQMGTEQFFHSDSIHFSSYPEKFMTGVWVALEDIEDDQGPLVYYPGTHKLPEYENIHYGFKICEGENFAQEQYHETWMEIVDCLEIEPEIFRAKKGDILIWASNLLHGGMPHLNLQKTRWSQVTHYFYEDCIYYQPRSSDFAIGHVNFLEPENLATGKQQFSKFLGEDISSYKEYVSSRMYEINSRYKRKSPHDFNREKYLELNPDVALSGTDSLFHYLNYGILEGRKYK
jgi:ectoine hydroxylase-related dioxygenase (phytanoyl-CoA dioxygenase family)